MDASNIFIILQLISFFVINECKLNEFYRWKQISFEKLDTGENLDIFVCKNMQQSPLIFGLI